MYRKVIAYDLETTGFSPSKDSILEIGAIAYYPKDGRRFYFSTLVSQKKRISKFTTKITGISERTLREEGSLPLRKALEAFNGFCYSDCENPLFVGHNIKSFDNRFMNISLGHERLPEINPKDVWDTFLQVKSDMVRERERGFFNTQQKMIGKRIGKKTDLKSACKYYRIRHKTPHHRALTDAETALELFLAQLRRNRYRVFSTEKQ